MRDASIIKKDYFGKPVQVSLSEAYLAAWRVWPAALLDNNERVKTQQ